MNSRYKVLLLGNSKIGKSLFLNSIVKSEYDSPTIGLNLAIYQVDDIEIVFWDVSGDDRYKEIRKSYYYDTDIVVICFHDYLEIEKWIEESCLSCKLFMLCDMQDPKKFLSTLLKKIKSIKPIYTLHDFILLCEPNGCVLPNNRRLLSDIVFPQEN